MAIVASTLGSSTITFWKRRSSAASFSMYLRYSSKVVAPIQWSSPRAKAGLSIFPASMAPSALPAPTIVWISSMNIIVRPSSLATSFKTAFRRSSNSPRYLAPASNKAMSSTKTRLSLSVSGTSPFTIRCARPSTIAVLPTPGSPIKTGLFLVRRCRICIVRRISSSRPMTGSSLPRRARSVKSSVYFLRASRWPSASAEPTDSPPRTKLIADSSDLRLKPFSRAALPSSPLSSAKTNKKSSPAIYWSPRLLASFSVWLSQLSSVRPICTSPFVPCTWGNLSIMISEAFSKPLILTPARVKRLRAPPSCWRSIANKRCSGSMNWLSFDKAKLWASPNASWNLVVNLSIRMIYLNLFANVLIYIEYGYESLLFK